MKRSRIKTRTSVTRSLVLALAMLLLSGNLVMAQGKAPKMTKQERVCLRQGNKLYEKKLDRLKDAVLLRRPIPRARRPNST